eukprot:1181477-Prorocentrum_minimum.AAC.1
MDLMPSSFWTVGSTASHDPSVFTLAPSSGLVSRCSSWRTELLANPPARERSPSGPMLVWFRSMLVREACCANSFPRAWKARSASASGTGLFERTSVRQKERVPGDLRHSAAVSTCHEPDRLFSSRKTCT